LLSMAERVAILSTFCETAGGTSTFVEHIRASSLRAGCLTVILSPDIKRDCSPCRIGIAGRSRPGIMLEAVRRLLKVRPVRIQCHGAWYLICAAVIYKFLVGTYRGERVRILSFKHSDIYSGMSTPVRSFSRLTDALCDCIVFPSDYLRQTYITSIKPLQTRALHTVNPGCDEAPAGSAAEEAQIRGFLEAGGFHPVLTYVGHFAYSGKVAGLFLLLDAIRQLRDRFPDLMLLVAGKGPYEQVVRSRIGDLDLDRNVHVFTDISTAFSLLEFSDLHCHITFQDAFGLTVIEALAAGVPVVASDYGEIPKIGVRGLVIAGNSKEEIVDCILKSLEAKPKVDRELLFRKYSWDRAASRLNDLLTI
jgi:glycosyltransferase involved in cell wall biosynthesis